MSTKIWFQQLRQTLSAYYPPRGDPSIVGYLQGSGSPATWRQMASAQNRHQMLILGAEPPTAREWEAAGVAQRGIVQTIRIGQLDGWIVLYGGFMYRPWGQLFEITPEALTQGFPAALRSWSRNAPRR